MQERLLFELLLNKPLAFLDDSVWASNSRYYVNGKVFNVPSKIFAASDTDRLKTLLEKYSPQNVSTAFASYMQKFCKANKERLDFITDEAFSFITESVKKYPKENIIISFSGGKDSTVTSDLVTRSLGTQSIVHIFGNTTLEFPETVSYAERYKKNHPRSIFKTAINKEQNFYSVCDDIGPPARMMRWCCSMFKTGPITRVLNSLYGEEKVLTFYGIRKSESVSRSKYNRLEDSDVDKKIKKQNVASPIFFWKDLDIWLYLLSNKVDFNDAYKMGYDRVGCWCCPNNNERAQFLSKIYFPELYKKWRSFLIDFAKKIGKPDAEVYVDTGKWKARQGGNGVKASEDIKIKFSNCTVEDNAKVYELNKEPTKNFYLMFTPFGNVNFELGRKLISEVLVLDAKTNAPILSIQPFTKDEYEFSVKIKTLNVADHAELQKKAGYQIRKYNACRKCLKCESICKFGAISIHSGEYLIDPQKCKHCRMCVTSKYLDGGCIMSNYLAVKQGKFNKSDFKKIKEIEKNK